jgi:hypothetical protein
MVITGRVPLRLTTGPGGVPTGSGMIEAPLGTKRLSFGADPKASMTLAVLMQNQVMCTPADSLPAAGRAV